MSPEAVACVPCRNRKVKCDRAYPKCESCSTSRDSEYLDCRYEKPKPGSSHFKKNAPRRFGACIPCKRKKKKCDGSLPCCGTCQAARIYYQCIYTSKWVHRQKTSTTVDFHEPIIHPNCGEMMKVSTKIQSPSLIIPDAHLLRPNSPIPLTEGGYPSKSALSQVSPGDDNMKFRITFLYHRFRLGFNLPLDKQQAILVGDLSNTIVNPFFISFSQIVGCGLYQQSRGPVTPMDLQNQALHVRILWEFVDNMSEEEDPFACVQVYQFLTFGATYFRLLPFARTLLKKALDIRKKFSLRFTPERTVDQSQQSQHAPYALPDFSEAVHERAVCLSRLIYMQVYLDFVIGDPLHGCEELERQFREVLPDAYPILFQACPIILATKSVLFAKDVRSFANLAHIQHEALYIDGFLTSLLSHIDCLRSLAGQFEAIGDYHGCVSLKSSTIICLTALAELYFLSAKDREASPEYYDTMKRLVEITGGLSQDDYMLLDPFIHACWSRAISLLTTDGNSSDLPSFSCHSKSDDGDSVKSIIIIVSQSRTQLDHVDQSATAACRQLTQTIRQRLVEIPSYVCEQVDASQPVFA